MNAEFSRRFGATNRVLSPAASRSPWQALCLHRALLVGTALTVSLGLCSGPARALGDAEPGTVLFHSKVSQTEGGFVGPLGNADAFGSAVGWMGDLDGDEGPDFAVGAPGDDSGGGAGNRGAVWLLFTDGAGTVQSENRIATGESGFHGLLQDGDEFGCALSPLGDLDGDGVEDLIVGATGDDDGGRNAGAVWILFLRSNGSVRAHQKISPTVGDFNGTLDPEDQFGFSVSRLGDVDGDGVEDAAVGAPGDDDGGADRGAVWVLFLNGNGTVRGQQKISALQGGFLGTLEDGVAFGSAVSELVGSGDGHRASLAVGSPKDGDGGPERGAVWLLDLGSDGRVRTDAKISSAAGGFLGPLADGDRFGRSVAPVGDLNGDGFRDLAVGAHRDHEGGSNQGAIWVLFRGADGAVEGAQKIGSGNGGFTGVIDDGDFFGQALVGGKSAASGGVNELLVGAPGDDDGGSGRGGFWRLGLEGSDVSSLPDAPEAIRWSRMGPNPTSDRLALQLDLSRRERVVVSVIDPAGREIRKLAEGVMDEGSHLLHWDLRDARGRWVPSGVYFVRTAYAGRREARSISVIR